MAFESSALASNTTISAWLCEVARFVDEPAPAHPPFVAGDRVLDRYEVRRLLGQGGMGFVYEVYDHERGRSCALKTLREVGPERIMMLKNEFRAIARVHHPNLVRPGELREHHGRWLFTMELIEGYEPVRWVGGDEAKLRWVIGNVADVLAAIHAHGLVHRDIKPSNLIIGDRDRVVVLDLGVARDSSRPLWFDRDVAGTSVYVAPEQLARTHPVGPAADMYSLGVLLFELATGRRPFADANPTLRTVPRTSELPSYLADLCDALMHPDPAARPSASAVAAQLACAPNEVSVGPTRALIGRTRELAELRTAYEHAQAGRTAIVFVHGASGIGKTALVNTFLDGFKGTRVCVLAGRCYERESVPYKTLDGIIDAVGDLLARDPRMRAAVPAECAVLGRAFPALTAVEGFTADGGGPSAADELPKALHSLLVSLARPIVLFVDDLQWADHDGLAALCRTLEIAPLPVLLVATSRERELPAALARAAPHFVVEVGPLSSADAQALVEVLVGEGAPEVIERIVRESRGHPLLMDEASRLIAGRSHVHDLDEAIAHRVSQLAPGARDVVELVAVAGAPLPHAVLAAAKSVAGGVDHDVHVLVNERLARWHDRGAAVDTFHDRVREALHARLAPPKRRELHARLTAAFEQAQPDAHAQLAVHGAEAGRHEMALRHALIAAEQATAGLAHAHAAELLGLALTLVSDGGERKRLATARAQALARAWLPAQAARAYAEVAESEPSVPAARRLRMLAVEQSLHAGELELGLHELELALRAANIRLPRRAWSAIGYALVRRIELRLPSLRSRSREVDAVDIDVLWSAASMLAMNDAFLALGYHSRALRLARDLGDPVRLGRSLALEACIQAGTGSFAESTRLCATATQLVGGHPLAAFNVRGAHLVLSVQLGEWQQGLDRLTEDLVNPNVWSNAAHQLYISHCELNLGRFLELAKRADNARQQVRDRADRYLELAMSVSFLPVTDLIRDEPARAKQTLERGRQLLWRGGRGYFHALAAVSALFVELYTGDYERALALWREGNTLLARKSHYGRVYLTYLGACAALGLHRKRGGRATRDIVLKAIRNLSRDPIPWAAPYGSLLEAQLRHLDRDRQRREQALAAARAGFAKFGSQHMLDIVDRRQGGLRGVSRPSAFSRMLAPGFD